MSSPFVSESYSCFPIFFSRCFERISGSLSLFILSFFGYYDFGIPVRIWLWPFERQSIGLWHKYKVAVLLKKEDSYILNWIRERNPGSIFISLNFLKIKRMLIYISLWYSSFKAKVLWFISLRGKITDTFLFTEHFILYLTSLSLFDILISIIFPIFFKIWDPFNR